MFKTTVSISTYICTNTEAYACQHGANKKNYMYTLKKLNIVLVKKNT